MGEDSGNPKYITETKKLKLPTRLMKPTIGITLDYVKEGSFSARPHYALREHYFNAVSKVGGVPFGIPYNIELIDEFLGRIDGLIIPGGDFGLDAGWYEAGEKSPFEASPRLQFDIEIIRRALAKKIPVLGICAGMQILAGMHGCKLTGDVMKFFNTEFNHLDAFPSEEYAHRIKITGGSLLQKIVGADEISVNSRHREGVISAPENVRISAVADDGVVKAVELPSYGFALGVQWHPEYFLNEGDQNRLIFEELIKQSIANRASK